MEGRKSPTNFDYVTACIQFEHGRIKNPSNLQELLNFSNEVCHTVSVYFHCDMGHSVESTEITRGEGAEIETVCEPSTDLATRYATLNSI